MSPRLSAAALATAALLSAPATAMDADRAPKRLALMSAADVVRAIRCAIPLQCADKKPKPAKKRK